MGDWADAETKNIVEEYYIYHNGQLEWLVAKLAAALRNEREACAKLAENLDDIDTCPMCPRDVAKAIRAAR